MTDDRWARIDTILQAAFLRPPDARAAFIRDACGDDEALRDEVMSLLAHEGSADRLFEPARAGEHTRLGAGQTLGAYTITGFIGAGGMGEVYRARDPRLGRDVAIKILPSVLAADPGRLRRFEQEARAAAALTHPNIIELHDIGEHEGIRFLVLELVEGETLARRLQRGQISLNNVLVCGAEIAGALDRAHRNGIVHRDLKPANVMLTTDGAKLLDFGLAKLRAAAFSDSMARTGDLTAEGALLGTVEYMSPEQAQGGPTDHRTDIFALGVMLYECATGVRPFEGATNLEVLSSILRDTPKPVTDLNPILPREFSRVVRRCLEKDPDSRYQSVRDVQHDLIDIKQVLESGKRQFAQAPAPRRWFQRWRAPTLLGLLGIAAAGYWLAMTRGPALAPAEQTASEILPPPGVSWWRGLSLSPDGRTLLVNVSTSFGGGGTYLWLRDLASAMGKRLEGTDGAQHPFWAPDGRSVAFFADRKLKRLDLAGGAPIPICNADAGWGGAWLDDGTIVFAPSSFSGLQRVRAEGGQPESFLDLDTSRGEVELKFPIAIDQRSVMYLARNTDPARSELRRVSLDAPGESRTLVQTASSGAFAGGWVFYDREGPVVAQRLDERTGALTGEPRHVAASWLAGGTGAMQFAASGRTLAWWTSRPVPAQLEWADRRENRRVPLGDLDVIGDIALSPDDQHVAVVKGVVKGEGLDRQQDIWLTDTSTGKSTPVSTDPGPKLNPIWSRDGRLAFGAYLGRGGMMNLYFLHASRPSPIVPIANDLSNLYPVGWIPADQSFAWLRPLGGDATLFVGSLVARDSAREVARKPFGVGARLSPDAALIAYSLREAGQLNLYVDRFPALSGPPHLVSRNITGIPRWRQDGRELFFSSADYRLMAVTVEPGATLRVGTPVYVLQLPTKFWAPYHGPIAFWDVNHDGSRFLLNVPKGTPLLTISLVQNWSPGAK